MKVPPKSGSLNQHSRSRVGGTIFDVAILTPAGQVPAGRWLHVLDGYRKVFRDSDVNLTDVSSTSDEDVIQSELVLPLLAWSYHLRKDDWLAKLDQREKPGVGMHNLATVLRWNTRKTYFDDLAPSGIATVLQLLQRQPVACKFG